MPRVRYGGTRISHPTKRLSRRAGRRVADPERLRDSVSGGTWLAPTVSFLEWRATAADGPTVEPRPLDCPVAESWPERHRGLTVIRIALIALGAMLAAIGLKGITQEGIWLTRERQLKGPVVRILGVVVIVAGIAVVIFALVILPNV